DQDPLYNQYNFNLPSSLAVDTGVCAGMANAGGVTTSTANQAVYKTKLAAHLCPSDPVAAVTYTNVPNTANFYEANEVARSNYLFSTGYYSDYDAGFAGIKASTSGPANIGVFGNDGACRIGDILD